MKKLLIHAALAFFVLTPVVLASGAANAAERDITLTVLMTCPTSEPPLVRKTLLDVNGVSEVAVSYSDKNAYVIFDDAVTNEMELIAAINEIGLRTSRDEDGGDMEAMDDMSEM